MKTIKNVMHALVSAIAILSAVVLIAPNALADTLNVNNVPTKLTGNTNYGRNPSIVKFAGNYYLFYTVSQNGGERDPYDPDADSYGIWYKKASTIAGLETATPTLIPGSDSAPAGFNQRDVVAFEFNPGFSMLYVYASSGQSGTDKNIYAYIGNGSTWYGGPTAFGGFQVGHHDVVVAGGVYLVYEDNAGQIQIAKSGDGANFSAPTLVRSSGGMPRMIYDGSDWYMVYTSGNSIKLATNPNADPTTGSFTDVTTFSPVVPADGNYDPDICQVGSEYRIYYAPYNTGTDTQWIEATTSDDPGNAGSWSTAQVHVTSNTGTWTYWPTPFVDGSDAYLFYTAEASPGNIFMLDDYPTIQAAIDAATAGDTINVPAGTYTEYVHITTDNLTIQGAGIDQSIIDLDGLEPYWHYPGNASYASRAGVYFSGYGSPDEIVENITFSGFTVKNAGLNPPTTSTGSHDGSDDASILEDSTATWTPGALVGQWVHNYGDRDTDYNPARSYGQITANTATTVTAPLSGGVDNNWDTGDSYIITSYESFYDGWGDGQEDIPGIGIANGKTILIEYCKVENCGKYGISAGKARLTSLQQSEDVTIDNCVAVDNDDNGISVGNYIGTVTITNNTCSNNGGPHLADPTREYQGVGIEVGGKKGGSPPMSGLISGNTCSDNGYQGIVLKKYSDGVTIENNTVTGHNIDEDGAGIFFYGDKSNPANCQNNIIRNNPAITGNIRGIVAYYAQLCTIEGNTITTDAGGFAQGQAAIKIDGGNNITVKNNTISCDGIGIQVQKTWDDVDCYDNTFTGNTISGAKFAGIAIWSGAHDNTFTDNTITGTTMLTLWAGETWEETQGDGVFLDDDAGTGNVFNYNSISGNADDGMENQVTTTTVDALNNYWGSPTGPTHAGNPGGTGESVSDYVDYDPYLDYRCSCTMVPDAPAVPRGTSLGLTATVRNNTGTAGRVNFVTFVTSNSPLPSKRYPNKGYLVNRTDKKRLRMNPLESKSGHVTHPISLTAPLGFYTYQGYVGWPGNFDTCSFVFEVTP